MEVSLPVSSSSQKEEPRFLPRAVDGATEVERLGAPSRPERPGAIRTQRVPCTRRTREQRARQPAINDPSFGEDPERPGLWSRPSFEALREGQLVTAKHFPGYWDTFIDSHHALASVDGDLAHPAGGRAFRAKWKSNPAWMRAGGIQLEQTAASIGSAST